MFGDAILVKSLGPMYDYIEIENLNKKYGN